MKTTFYCAMSCAMVLLTVVEANAQTTVFRTEFEYTTEPTSAAIGTNAANLNSADNQIGSFFGTTPLPAAGSQFSGTGSIFGFENHPDNGSRLLWVDRPEADGAFSAVFANPVEVDGATVSFDVGTRRTVGGNRNKDYDIVGVDQNGNELFRLTVNTQNGQERLGVTHSGGTLTSNLISDFGGVGSDANLDLDNLGAPPFDTNEIGTITLDLTDTGYSIDFANANGSNAYTTNEIPFNGVPNSPFAQIDFLFPGDPTNPLTSGFVLDNISVQGTVVPEPSTIAIWSLLGLSLCGFGYFRWRRER